MVRKQPMCVQDRRSFDACAGVFPRRKMEDNLPQNGGQYSQNDVRPAAAASFGWAGWLGERVSIGDECNRIGHTTFYDFSDPTRDISMLLLSLSCLRRYLTCWTCGA